jgi:hypothetical protein
MRREYLLEYSGETKPIMRSPPFSLTGQFDRLPPYLLPDEDFSYTASVEVVNNYFILTYTFLKKLLHLEGKG